MDVLKIAEKIKRLPHQTEESLKDMFDLVLALDSVPEKLEFNRWVRKEAMKIISAEMYNLIKKTYLLGAKSGIFSDYLIYIEWNRKPEKRFYQPRMHYLRPMIQGYQDILDGKLDLLTISQPKRTGKALTLDTKLLTPTGFMRMGDVQIGTILIGAD